VIAERHQRRDLRGAHRKHEAVELVPGVTGRDGDQIAGDDQETGRAPRDLLDDELSGFVGEATYEGELSEFLPWLALGELIHIGKHTAWGNGRIELQPGTGVKC